MVAVVQRHVGVAVGAQLALQVQRAALGLQAAGAQAPRRRRPLGRRAQVRQLGAPVARHAVRAAAAHATHAAHAAHCAHRAHAAHAAGRAATAAFLRQGRLQFRFCKHNAILLVYISLIFFTKKGKTVGPRNLEEQQI